MNNAINPMFQQSGLPDYLQIKKEFLSLDDKNIVGALNLCEKYYISLEYENKKLWTADEARIALFNMVYKELQLTKGV
jgi:hypothetical protein